MDKVTRLSERLKLQLEGLDKSEGQSLMFHEG